jgi:hypothetical protein
MHFICRKEVIEIVVGGCWGSYCRVFVNALQELLLIWGQGYIQYFGLLPANGWEVIQPT